MYLLVLDNFVIATYITTPAVLAYKYLCNPQKDFSSGILHLRFRFLSKKKHKAPYPKNLSSA
jgi:hypothetical protein